MTADKNAGRMNAGKNAGRNAGKNAGRNAGSFSLVSGTVHKRDLVLH